MAFINLLGLASSASPPGGFITGMWSWFLLTVFQWIPNYGWRVVVFTLLLKIVLSPIDIISRVKMRKNQRIIQSLKPEVEKLEKQYGGNPQALQQKKNELNKKNGVKMTAGCLPMLVTMILSMWLLLGGLNPISQYMNMMQYLELFDAYTAAERANIAEGEFARYFIIERNEDDDIIAVTLRPVTDAVFDEAGEKGTTEEESLNHRLAHRADVQLWAQAPSREAGWRAVYNRYFGIYEFSGYRPVREGFLWVRNIWVSDTVMNSAIMNFGEFMGSIGRFSNAAELGLTYSDFGLPETASEEEIQQAFQEQVIDQYSIVMRDLIASDHNRANGFFILPIISIAVMIVNQLLTKKLQKKSGTEGGMGAMGMPGMMPGAGGSGKMGKIMMFVMPVMFGVFSLFFTAAFALYIIANSLVMILITLGANGVIHLLEKREKKEEVTEEGVIRYGRPDPNAPKPEGLKPEKENKKKKK